MNGAVLPSTIADTDGNLHAVWIDKHQSSSSVFYAYKPFTDTWTAPIVVNPEHTEESWVPEVALDKDSKLHAVWLEYSYWSSTINYAFREHDGTWSPTFDLSGPIHVWSPKRHSRPDIVVDEQNMIHIVWADQGGLWYINNLDPGGWSNQIRVANIFSAHAITGGMGNTLHLVYVESGVTYRSRSAEGIWSDPVSIAEDHFPTSIEIATDAASNVHLIYVYDYGNVYYSNRGTTGQWAIPISISYEKQVYEISLTVDSNNSHILWRSETGLEYLRQFKGDSWSPIFNIQAAKPYLGLSLISKDDHTQAFWSEGETSNWEIVFSEWDLPQVISQTISQSITIPQDMHKPTLSFMYYADQQGLGSIFDVEIQDTKVYSTANISTTWVHEWNDLTPWLGQTITLAYSVRNDLAQGILDLHIDDVSVGPWLTPYIDGCSPDKIRDWYDFQSSVIISGFNFIETPTVRIGDVPALNVQWIDENTLTAVIPASLPVGKYDIWVINPEGQVAVFTSGLQLGDFIYLPNINR